MPNPLASVPTLTYQATYKKLLAPVTLDPTPEDLEAQKCVRSRIAKIERELLGGRATTVKRYRKRKGATRLLAASRVGGVVTTQEPIVSPEVELMRRRILADYERDVFSGEVRLRPGQEHPKVRGTERLGFAKLNLYPNAKPMSVKPIRLVGERAAAEQEIVEDLLARGWIEPCPASEWASNGFVVPKKEKGKWRLVVDYRQLNEATLPDAHPLPLIENMLENQSKHEIFTIVYLSKGFHQIPLHPESRAKTAMNLAGKRYQWRVMPMGIKNGPAIFERVMDHVLQGLDCADIYIDDIIIGSSGATCVPCWIGYEQRSWLLRLAKPISMFVRLSFVAMCWKMAHIGRRQGKSWRLSVGTNRIMFGSSGGSWGSPTIIRAMSKTTPP